MSKNCIIYLGGSISHSSNFEYLKKKKYKIILIDKNTNCFCRKYCDIFLNYSHLEIKKILISLKKIFKSKKYNLIDCFGTAHYSFHAVNKIKKRYITGYEYDDFLTHKYVQKKKLKDSNLIPEFINLPSLIKLKQKKKYYINKIYNFYKKKNFNIFIKSDGKHQGEGIININYRVSKTEFIKKYFKTICNLFRYTKQIYIEEKVYGKLLNIDFIKKRNGEVIFLPIIYRDKVILYGKKKYLSVYQYLDGFFLINERILNKLRKILNNIYIQKQVFGTIDAMVDKSNFKILEFSPHFHNSKIHKFLNNTDLLDLHLSKNYKNKIKNIKLTNKGGYIFVHKNNKFTHEMRRFVIRNSQKVHIDYIDIAKRKSILKKNASIGKDFHLIYFKVKNDLKLNLISDYLEKNKKYIY